MLREVFGEQRHCIQSDRINFQIGAARVSTKAPQLCLGPESFTSDFGDHATTSLGLFPGDLA